jgi:hypothetical protein
VPSIRALLAVLAVGAGIACRTDLLAPSSEALAGHWSRTPEPLSPSGQFFRTLEFTTDGRYVATTASRGVYAQLPADAIGSITRAYGTYVLDGDTLRSASDSVRSWDYLTGTHLQVGSPGVYIEGPPTDPVVELTRTRLTLRYMVNPGAGYVPVVEEYLRDR